MLKYFLNRFNRNKGSYWYFIVKINYEIRYELASEIFQKQATEQRNQFIEGVTDSRTQFFPFSELETRLKAKIKCGEHEKIISSDMYIEKIKNLTRKEFKQRNRNRNQRNQINKRN